MKRNLEQPSNTDVPCPSLKWTNKDTRILDKRFILAYMYVHTQINTSQPRSGRTEACKDCQFKIPSHHIKTAINIPLAPKGNLNPLPLLIRLLLNLRAEADRTHDTIPELLVDHTLVSVPVVLHNLVQPVDQGFTRGHLERTAAVREVHDLGLAQLGLGDVEDLGQVLDVLLVGWGVAVEHGGGRDLLAAEGLGDGFEGEVLGLFGGEEEAAVGGEFGGGGCLEGLLVLRSCLALFTLIESLRRVLRSADRWRFLVPTSLLVLWRRSSFAGSRRLQ